MSDRHAEQTRRETEQRAERASIAPRPDALTPADRYQELFVDVQRSRVFDDSKTFVDCAPLAEPSAILAAYRVERASRGFDLPRFVAAHFEPERPPSSGYASSPGMPLARHIDELWDVLTRHPSSHALGASALPLPGRYVVPGGRFRELYYWDSYFVMVGLAASGREDLVLDMLEAFAHLVDEHGHVPNGTRTYYLSRSQPPVLSLMVALARRSGLDGTRFLDHLRAEHAYWMRGEEEVGEGEAMRRVVRLPGGAVLNRYWDDRDTPREESWLEDVTTAAADPRPGAIVFREIRAAAESGWDFSSRWLPDAPRRASADPDVPTARSLAGIRTTELAAIDLNALLFALEQQIADLGSRAGQRALAAEFESRASRRRAAIHSFCWSDEGGAFFDYDHVRAMRSTRLTAACAAPLFVGLAEPERADVSARTLERHLLATGGLATTEIDTDQQWDRPNGWAPLQWIAIEGLRAYGHERLANTIADRWLATVAAVYEREGKLIEKYALRRRPEDATEIGGGGEYPLQDGFGWTNGVTRALLARRTSHSAHLVGAHARAPLHR